MDKAEIFEWLKSQKYQTTYDEVGEYTTYYGVDMPKILEDYYEYKVKKLNEPAVSGSAYIAKLNDGEEICVIAKNIADAFDKLEQHGYVDYSLINHKSYDII